MELNKRLRTVKNAFISGSFGLFSADGIETICGHGHWAISHCQAQPVGLKQGASDG